MNYPCYENVTVDELLKDRLHYGRTFNLSGEIDEIYSFVF